MNLSDLLAMRLGMFDPSANYASHPLAGLLQRVLDTTKPDTTPVHSKLQNQMPMNEEQRILWERLAQENPPTKEELSAGRVNQYRDRVLGQDVVLQARNHMTPDFGVFLNMAPDLGIYGQPYTPSTNADTVIPSYRPPFYPNNIPWGEDQPPDRLIEEYRKRGYKPTPPALFWGTPDEE